MLLLVIMVVLSLMELVLLLLLMRLLLLFKLELSLISFSLCSLSNAFQTVLFFTRPLSLSSLHRGIVAFCFITLPLIRIGLVTFEAVQRRKDLRGPLSLFSFLDSFSLLLLLSDSSAINASDHGGESLSLNID
jgi:hypothetical protein